VSQDSHRVRIASMARVSPKTTQLPKDHCRFYIVRHGQTEWNVAHRIQGHADSPLTQKGINQAKARAKTLGDVKFGAVYSSDLLRTQRTADILTKEHKLEVKTHKAIREKSYGIYEGRVVEEIKDELAEIYNKRSSLKREDRLNFKVHESTESDEEMNSRFITFLKEVAVAHAGQNVLIVAHNGIMKALLIKLGHFEYEEADKYFIENLGYYILDGDGVEFWVRETPGIKRIGNE